MGGEPELAQPPAGHVPDLMDTGVAPPSRESLRAVESLRALMRWTVTAEVDAAIWARLADGLAELRARLPECEAGTRYARPLAGAGAGAAPSGLTPNVRGTHPLVGRANPVAPPIELRVEGERAFGDLCFGPTHEGIPGCAHGGYIAAGFDIVLAQAAWLSRSGGGVTGTLTVRYRSRTPIGVPLRYEAWPERSGGRSTRVEGRLCTVPPAGSAETAQICAEAEGIFVSIASRAPAGAGEER